MWYVWTYNFNYKYIKGWNVGVISFNPWSLECVQWTILVPKKWPIYPDQVTAYWFKKPYINVIASYDFKNKFQCAFNYRLYSKSHCKKVIHVCHAL